MIECGTADDHCCWLKDAGECRFVRKVEGDPVFFWECTLRVKYGSWQAMYESEEYKNIVRPALDLIPVIQDCGAWPPPGKLCNTCGRVGS